MPSQALWYVCRSLHGFSLLCVNPEEGRGRSGMVEEEGGSGQITCFSTLDTKGKSLVGLVCLLGGNGGEGHSQEEPYSPHSRWPESPLGVHK